MVGRPGVRARQAQPGEAQTERTTIARWRISLERNNIQRCEYIQHCGSSSSSRVSETRGTEGTPEVCTEARLG